VVLVATLDKAADLDLFQAVHRRLQGSHRLFGPRQLGLDRFQARIERRADGRRDRGRGSCRRSGLHRRGHHRGASLPAGAISCARTAGATNSEIAKSVPWTCLLFMAFNLLARRLEAVCDGLATASKLLRKRGSLLILQERGSLGVWPEVSDIRRQRQRPP